MSKPGLGIGIFHIVTTDKTPDSVNEVPGCWMHTDPDQVDDDDAPAAQRASNKRASERHCLCRCLQYALTNGAHITLNSYGAMNANSAALSSAVFATSIAGQLFVTAAGKSLKSFRAPRNERGGGGGGLMMAWYGVYASVGMLMQCVSVV